MNSRLRNKLYIGNPIVKLIIQSFVGFVAVLLVLTLLMHKGLIWYTKQSLISSRIEKLMEKLENMDDVDYNLLNVNYYLGKRGDLFLLDERGAIIYSSDDDNYSDFLMTDLAAIPDYNSKSKNRITQYKNKNKNNEKMYLITNEVKRKNNINEVKGYILLDKDRNIIESTFSDNRISLTEEEVSALTGMNEYGLTVRKHSFTNPSGDKRLLVFISEMDFIKNYKKPYGNIHIMCLYYILVYVILVIGFIYFLTKKIKKMMKPIYDLNEDFGEGDIFKNFAHKYKDLYDNLAQSEWERSYLDNNKNQLLADISHDLRTPITVIKGYSIALRDEMVLEEDKDKYIDTIIKKSEQVDELVTTLHEYSKLENPRMPINLIRQDICSIVQIYFANKYEEVELAGFELEADIPEFPIYCNLDKKLFSRVIENLVNNTLKYNDKGTIIFVKIKLNDDNVKIYIGDTGKGIPREIHHKLFEPFVTGEYSRGGSHGSGLGLAITKKIIVSHGGSITLLEEPLHNCKTEYLIILPIVD